MPIFYESKANGKVGIDQHLSYANKTETYHERLKELKLILPEAAREFNFDSLTSMSLGRLFLSGDLAIHVTQAYTHQFGEKKHIITATYDEISAFLLGSKLGQDYNELFKPYAKVVEGVAVEKVFFTTKENLIHNSKVSMDTTTIPENILDATVWVNLKNSKIAD